MLEKSPSDTTLLPKMIDLHEKRFGSKMESLSVDTGFKSEEKKLKILSETLTYLAAPKRLSDLGDEVLMSHQCFHTGIEGTISWLFPGF